jgi:hypothetical protein
MKLRLDYEAGDSPGGEPDMIVFLAGVGVKDNRKILREAFTGAAEFSHGKFPLTRKPSSLFVQKAFPSRRNASSWPRHSLFRRMRARTAQLRTLKGFSCSVIVEPVLARLEAINDRVARGGVVL